MPHGSPFLGDGLNAQALGSLRMEKGYRDYGHDLDNLDSLLEAGLGFTADFGKGEFRGRGKVLEQKQAPQPLRRRLMQVMLTDPEPLLYHGEVRGGAIDRSLLVRPCPLVPLRSVSSGCADCMSYPQSF